MTDTESKQEPEPGASLLKTRGDTISFLLHMPENVKGQAWLRTNLGRASVIRKEIIRAVTHDEPLLGRDFYDIPMEQTGENRFRLKLGLCETGHFEAKCCFLPEGESSPVWPAGENVSVNVSPADTCCANIIYNAFVRQFGPNKDGSFQLDSEEKKVIKELDQSGYSVIPPSGTFRDLINELDFIICTLGCRFIQLLPVNPTPTTYGRMGRFGSPYASLDFTGIDPALAEFDPKATPLEQFMELADAVHARSAKLILDIAPNHTGWAAELHETHPEWLARDEEGNIEAPGAWGIVWEDLAKLDYSSRSLWQYMGEVFLTWCRRGVDGFRCDAGYMIPVEAWMYIVSAVREEFPEAVFFLEGLGGKLNVTRQILEKAGFDWAYSELFQNYDRQQIEAYLPEPMRISGMEGLMIHFAETHDNNRLASTSTKYAAMRTALCALCSHRGGFGFANGVEWFADEKIDVHDAKSLNWGSSANQTGEIARISLLLKTHPAFFDNTDIRMIQSGPGNALVFLRHHGPSGKRLLVIANLDWEKPQEASWNPENAGMKQTVYTDLLTGLEAEARPLESGLYVVSLEPGKVLCLSPEKEGLKTKTLPLRPERASRQRLRAAALTVFKAFYGTSHLEDADLDKAAEELAAGPAEFCRRINPSGSEHRVIKWQWPADSRRHVMIPQGHFLLVEAEAPFQARITEKKANSEKTLAAEDSMPCRNGSHFALIPPISAGRRHAFRSLKLSVFESSGFAHSESSLLYLGNPAEDFCRRRFGRPMLKKMPDLKFLGTNGRGAMMRAGAAWSGIESKYDGLLAANLNPEYPENRHMMLIRCRAWTVYQGFSQEVSIDCQQQFSLTGGNACRWSFILPCGQGQHASLSLEAQMIPEKNKVVITALRRPAAGKTDRLPDSGKLRLIIRPDIDDRSFHENTKAYLGPEHQWPEKCSADEKGFTFRPDPERVLRVQVSEGNFVPEPEWQYMAFLPVEAERGMDPHTDLFSPGYFSVYLEGGSEFELTAEVNPESSCSGRNFGAQAKEKHAEKEFDREASLETALREALKSYIVKRGGLATIIAGYPWFLDWGRDTLIAARGLAAAGYLRETEDILTQFAEFEESGTLPNMIRGTDAGNRDTSDAPLWFFTACRDLVRARGSREFLEKDLGGRTVAGVLESIAENYIKGTPNGIRMDSRTGLVFSPPHFTWMDTNHPAGSPRQGYPVEIQALWHSALNFLAEIGSPGKDWKGLSEKAGSSIETLFPLHSRGFLSDCLHADEKTSAADAVPDDALRPNQLLAATLGALKNRNRLREMLDQCMELLVPGAVRSLADRPVEYPLAVIHQGRLLNDPNRPYRGVYKGDEDTSRKPAYHNGTAWTWIFPSFCEAWASAYGEEGRNTALSWLSSSSLLLNSGSAGQIPEILDGDSPHTQRGCDSQAWGVSELLRVWLKLKTDT